MGGAFIDGSQSIATIYELAVDDYVELLVRQNSGGALNISTKSNQSPEFSMIKAVG